MQETPGSSKEDIYDDLDSLFSTKVTTTRNPQKESSPPMSKCTNVKKDDSCNSLPSMLSDDCLIKEGLDLYLELVSTETKNKKASLYQQPEFVKLQQKVATLEKLLAEKDAQICNLEKQNNNFRKNISSLYKTAKFEVAQKDDLLREANKEIDRLFFRLQNFNECEDGQAPSLPSQSTTYQRHNPKNPNRMETTGERYKHSDINSSHYECSRSSQRISSTSWNLLDGSKINKNSEEGSHNFESKRNKYFPSPSQDASHSKFYDGKNF